MLRPKPSYPDGLHTCSGCNETKPVATFSYANKARGKLQARCKACCSIHFKSYRAANIDKFRAYKRGTYNANKERYKEARRLHKETSPEREFIRKRKSYLKTKFGITPDGYEAMLIGQNGKCAICATTEPGRASPYFHIDHCHDTGKIRALLCNGCNLGLGHFKDNIDRLSAAISYLEVHS